MAAHCGIIRAHHLRNVEVSDMAKKKTVELIGLGKHMLDAARRSAGSLEHLSEADREFVFDRYRKFLALAKRHPRERLAPTADIDEMWHLHMLMPLAYVKDCEDYFGYVLDHNGGFGRRPEEADELKAIFERTAKLWKDQYGEDYVVAGTASPLALCFSAATQAYSRCHAG
jgi:Glycine-rich domain-containing protein-like